MKRILVFIAFLFTGLSNTIAQDYYVKSYDPFDHTNDFVFDIVEYGDSILLTNFARCNNFQDRCHSNVLIDKQGNLIDANLVDCIDVGIDIVVDNNVYYKGGKISTDIPKFRLYKAEIGGAELACVDLTITEEGYQSFFSKGVIEYNGQIVVYGTVTNTLAVPGEDYIQGLIFWINKESFEYEYTFINPPELLIRLEHMMIDKEGNLNVLCEFTTGNNNSSKFKKILRFNSNRELIFEWDSYRLNGGAGPGVLLELDNGNFVMDIVDSVSSRVNLLCITPEGEEVFNTDFSEGRKGFIILNLKKASDGNFFVIGNIFSPYYDYPNYASIMKVTSDGSLDWQRLYAIDMGEALTGDPSNGKRSAFYDMVELENGDLMAAGSISNGYDDPVHGYRLDQDLFVVRVDSTGCLSPDCEVIQEIGGEGPPKLFVDPLNQWNVRKVDEDTGEYYMEAYRFNEERVFLDRKYYYNELLVATDDELNDWQSTGMYMRERFDRVYLYDTTILGGEAAFYDFDSYIMSAPVFEIFDLPTVAIQTIELDSTTLLNGERRGVTRTRCWNNTGGNIDDERVWIQGIGDVKGILSVVNSCQPDNGDRLACFYHDGELLWQNEEVDNCGLSPVQEIERLEMVISPNPALTEITVSAQESIALIEIYTTDLKLISTSLESTIDISTLQPGVYIVRGIDDKGMEGYDIFCKI